MKKIKIKFTVLKLYISFEKKSPITNESFGTPKLKYGEGTKIYSLTWMVEGI